MPGGANLALKYAKQIDERWAAKSAISLVSGKFNFEGDRTVKVYSIPTAPLVDYTRSGMSRYGTPDDLGRNVQTMIVTQDKAFTFVIDEGDYVQSEHVMNSGSALDRQIREVIVPYYDGYCYHVMSQAAINHGNNATTAITKSNAHEMLLNGVQRMADQSVPVTEVVCYCSYAFYNYLLQDSSFVRYSNLSQQMLDRGEIGEADGIKMVRVPSAWMPAGTAFMLVHKDAIVAPRQIQSYLTHKNPVGVNGTVCEGRLLFDCFVLNQKAAGIYFHGGQSQLKPMIVQTTRNADGTVKVIVISMKEKSGNVWYAKTATDQSSLPTISITTAIDPSSGAWAGAFEVTSNEFTFEPTSGHTRMRIAEVGSNSKPIAYVDVDIPELGD